MSDYGLLISEAPAGSTISFDDDGSLEIRHPNGDLEHIRIDVSVWPVRVVRTICKVSADLKISVGTHTGPPMPWLPKPPNP